MHPAKITGEIANADFVFSRSKEPQHEVFKNIFIFFLLFDLSTP
jgi:hypothetical protein